MGLSAAGCAFCFIMVIVVIVILVAALNSLGSLNSFLRSGGLLTNADYGHSSGSRAGYYYSGIGGSYGGSRGGYGGSYGGGRGGGWGCFDENTIVWTKNETQQDTKAKEILISNLKEGDLVGTLEPSFHQEGKFQFVWTRATDVTISTGNWIAHTFLFSKGHHLTATSPHLMIILKYGKSYLIRAEDVQVGDTMIVNETVTKVQNIRNRIIKRKVAIETEDGSVQVNGVLASGICEDNPEVTNRTVHLEALIKWYKSVHFGIEYNEMCMDTIAWKNSYLINNGYYE